ncbi:MAG: hypothetical protein AB1626_01400 [Candidatus Micrarchaeota archaeon]
MGDSLNRRGFFSSALNALVISAAIAAALLAVSHASADAAGVRELEAKRVADRVSDGRLNHERAVLDGVVDAAFQYYGCAALVVGTYCDNANSTYAAYLSNYSSYLNDSAIGFNASILGIYCNSTNSTADFNWSFAYAPNTSLTANTSYASKTVVDELSWTIEIRNYTPRVVNNTQVCNESVLMRIAVNDSDGYLLDYYVDCNQTTNLTVLDCP